MGPDLPPETRTYFMAPIVSIVHHKVAAFSLVLKRKERKKRKKRKKPGKESEAAAESSRVLCKLREEPCDRRDQPDLLVPLLACRRYLENYMYLIVPFPPTLTHSLSLSLFPLIFAFQI
jgi:hypothetical protein